MRSGRSHAPVVGAQPAGDQARSHRGGQPANTVCQSSRMLISVNPAPRTWSAPPWSSTSRSASSWRDDEPQRGPPLAAGEAQHLEVAVRVAARDRRAAAGARPDVQRLLRAVVEARRALRGVDDPAVDVLGPEAGADDALARDAVDRLRGRAHEVAVAARDDEGQEAVRLQVAQQLDHGDEPALEVRAAAASGAARRRRRRAPRRRTPHLDAGRRLAQRVEERPRSPSSPCSA